MRDGGNCALVVGVDVGDHLLWRIQAELRLKNAKAELDRVKSLLDEGAISQSDYDQLELNYKVSKSSYDNLRDNTILRSPVTGVVRVLSVYQTPES